MAKKNKMDRVEQLRDAFPELTEDQARMLLCLCYKRLTDDGVEGERIQVFMDQATKGMCNSPIQKIGTLLELVN
jgi:hypothetical protein